MNQLYEALNVREHQIKKERDIRSQLEKLTTELQPLEEVSWPIKLLLFSIIRILGYLDLLLYFKLDIIPGIEA